MNRLLYENYELDDLTLNDRLAIERTSLANERTLLSYVRTMIGLFAVGGTLIKFFTDRFIIFSGWVLLAVGSVTLVIGFMRYIRIYNSLSLMQKNDINTNLKNDRLQYMLWTTLKKLHLAPSKAN